MKERILFIMMMLDFLLTYYGIRVLGVLAEGNLFMVSLFNLDFTTALIVRLLLISIVVGVVRYIRNKGHRWYNILITTGLTANVIIMLMHLNWIIREMM